MLPTWLEGVSTRRAPLYLAIADAIAEAAASGALKPGQRLPSHRRVADALGVDLTTVTRAYAEARRRGVLDAVTGRGSFIGVRHERAGPPLDLGMNIPPEPFGMRLDEMIRRGIDDVLRQTDAGMLMSYHAGPGSAADRAAAARWLAPALGEIAPQRIVVCGGAQSALTALAATLARPGDGVACDALAYPGFLALARRFGLRLAGVGGDADGMRPDLLDAASADGGMRLLYLTPSIQNPLAVSMPERRRRDLVAVARKRGLTIIEDDPYGRFVDDPAPALAALAPERSFHVATLSKCLTPGLRIAHVVAPDEAAARALAEAGRLLLQMPAPLMSALVTQWIADGAAAAIAGGVRVEAAARQALARRILPASRGHANGLHVWLPLPERWNAARLREAAQAHGLGVEPAETFEVEPGASGLRGARVSLGAAPDRRRLQQALEALAGLIAGPAALAV